MTQTHAFPAERCQIQLGLSAFAQLYIHNGVNEGVSNAALFIVLGIKPASLGRQFWARVIACNNV